MNNSPETYTINLSLKTVSQLFNSMDPSPFNERDLDDDAVEYIMGLVSEAPPRSALKLLIHLGDATESLPVQEAVQNFFAYRMEITNNELKEHFRIGRISLGIGLLVLSLGTLGSEWISATWSNNFAQIASQGVLVGAWVAMWRPIEIYLYGWWPIRRRLNRYRQLAGIEVNLADSNGVVTRQTDQ